MDFGTEIIKWYNENKRDLPWRHTKDPYKIWLSEVLLQQTRVDQGLSYYLKFASNFPTVQDLASASEETVLKLWQGLGYYSRARNLHFAAKQIVDEFNGTFPTNYKSILTLKGVGEYTASAISSFCFNEKQAVVDGNVYRVISRFLSLPTPIDSSQGKKDFKNAAMDFLGTHSPSTFNQAIMELGATVCTPKKAKCTICPIQNSCSAFSDNKVYELPIKLKKIKKTNRYFIFLVLIDDGNVYFEQRVEKGIWHNMYQFPLIESSEEMTTYEEIELKFEILEVSNTVKHLLSHQNIYANFLSVQPKNKSAILEHWHRIPLDEISEKPVPRLIENYLKSNPKFYTK